MKTRPNDGSFFYLTQNYGNHGNSADRFALPIILHILRERKGNIKKIQVLLTDFHYFFVSLHCQSLKMRLADIVTKRCTTLYLRPFESGKFNYPHGKAIDDAHS